MMTALNVVRALIGALGLLSPRVAARWWGADPHSRGVAVTARVLGGRHLVQAAALTARRGTTARALSSAVDLLHGTSMVILAIASPRLRRPALTSAGVACGFLAGTLGPSLLRHLSSRPAAPPSEETPAGAETQAPDEAQAPDETQAPVEARTPDRPPTRGEIEAMQRSSERRAARLTRRSDRLEEASMHQPMPPWSPAAAWVLLLTGVWLLVGQWALPYPFTVTGQNTALRDTGLAVVVTLAALRLVVGRRSSAATGVILVSGVLLVCSALLMHHDATRTFVNELASGALVLLAGLATLDRPHPATTDRTSDDAPRHRDRPLAVGRG